MLAQVLNRDFMLSVAGSAADEFDRAIVMRSRRVRQGVIDDLSPEDLAEIASRLRGLADASEQLTSSSGGSALPREDAAPPKDDYAYVPRDPLGGIVQTVLEDEIVEQRIPVDTRRHAEDRRGPRERSAVTDQEIAGVPLRRTLEGRRVFGRYEVSRPKILSDWRWVASGIVIAYNKLRTPAAFNSVPAGPVTIGDQSRLVIVGDWGSGLPRARDVSNHMRKWIADGRRERRDVSVIHLGDVYYTGGKREYRDNFLACWPVGHREEARSLTLNGNHDMAQGAHHYFDTALLDPRFADQANSSMFSLRNDHWQVIGLDSAYEDGGLHGDQATWARELVETGGDRRTILLSHHQPFSVYEAGASTLRRKIAPILHTGGVDAWFWGHEHRCLVYHDAPNLPFASCVGHGGIPEYRTAGVDVPYIPPLTYDYRVPYGDGWQPWIRFGFVVVDLEKDLMHLRYVDEFGNVHYEESLQ